VTNRYQRGLVVVPSLPTRALALPLVDTEVLYVPRAPPPRQLSPSRLAA
jgi:hypothetical protein